MLQEGLLLASTRAGRDTLLRGGTPPDSIYAEGNLGDPGEWRMVIRGREKLVVDSSLKAKHLYHLGRDPYEMKNLVADRSHQEKREELLALLRRWIVRTSDVAPRFSFLNSSISQFLNSTVS